MTAATAIEVGMQDHALPWTEEEYFALGETIARVELFDGSLLVSPRPTFGHQDLSAVLRDHLLGPARANGLRVYLEVDIRLQPGRVVSPDLVICPPMARTATVGEAHDVRLVCEVTSTNAATDRVLKMHYYAAARIPWYLLVEPDEPLLLLHRLEGEHYVIDQAAKPGQLLHLTEPVTVTLDPATLTS